MTKQEWENTFGSVPENFERTVSCQLRKIEEEQPVKKIRMFTVVAIACIITLIGAIAYAAVTQWDIQSFGKRWYGVEITEEGQRALQTMQPGAYAAENDDVTVTVRQALYDGNTMYVMVATTPKHPGKTLLMLLDGHVEEPVCNLGLPDYENDMTPIKDSGLAKGKVLLGVEPALYIDGIEPDSSGHQAMEADGTLVSWIKVPVSVTPDVEEVEVECVTYMWDKQVKPEDLVFQKLSFTFPLKVTRLAQDAVVWPAPESE